VVPAARRLYSAEQLPGNIFEITSLVVTPRGAWAEVSDFIDGRQQSDLSMEQFNLYTKTRFPGMADRGRALESECSAGCDANLRGLRNMDAYKFCQSASWRPVYMDDVSLVFLRNTPGNSR